MGSNSPSRRGSAPLVEGYLEMISSQVFSEYPKLLPELIGGRHGVYALYKGSRLYYVGLAKNLRGRIRHHLRDRHTGKWDKFSLYLVREERHIKEIESLVLRIADPKGNSTKGKLQDAEDLRSSLKKRLDVAQREKRYVILGGKRRRGSVKRRRKKSQTGKGGNQHALAPYAGNGFKLRAVHKGKVYEAWVAKSGLINLNGKKYNSPSMAGKSILNRSVNGWKFWKYKNEDREWVRLDNLRK